MEMPLDRARQYADKIVAALEPYCSRIEVAGSIRRRRPVVHDIDLVVIPTDWPALKARALEHAHEITSGDCVFRLQLTTGIQVDIYRAHGPMPDLFVPRPTNWGTLLLCRTGSAEHNILLCRHAKALGRSWNPHHGVFTADETLIASETEEDVFRALDMDFIPPEEREV